MSNVKHGVQTHEKETQTHIWCKKSALNTRILYIYYRPYRQMLFKPCRLGLNYKPLLSRHNLEYMRYYNVLHHAHLFIFAV